MRIENQKRKRVCGEVRCAKEPRKWPAHISIHLLGVPGVIGIMLLKLAFHQSPAVGVNLILPDIGCCLFDKYLNLSPTLRLVFQLPAQIASVYAIYLMMYARDTATPDSAGTNKWDVSTIAAAIIGVLALAAAVPGAVLAVKKLRKASTNRRER